MPPAKKKAAASDVMAYDVKIKEKVPMLNPKPFYTVSETTGRTTYMLKGKSADDHNLSVFTSKDTAESYGKPQKAVARARPTRKTCEEKFDECKAKRGTKKGTEAVEEAVEEVKKDVKKAKKGATTKKAKKAAAKAEEAVEQLEEVAEEAVEAVEEAIEVMEEEEEKPKKPRKKAAKKAPKKKAAKKAAKKAGK